jgi:hypothetical protein
MGLVRTAGLEPARGHPQRILSPLRLPVPPRPHFSQSLLQRTGRARARSHVWMRAFLIQGSSIQNRA